MSRVTSKLQVTIPRSVADLYGIEPGDDIEFVPAGDSIRVLARRDMPDVDDRLALFDQATQRQRARQRGTGVKRPAGGKSSTGRGWTREELYERGRTG